MRTSSISIVIGLALVLAFALAITLPFAGQAVHMDDHIFIDFARTSLMQPFQQHIPNFRLMGIEFPEWRDTHPPLDQLYIAALIGSTGSQSEFLLHIGFVFFPLMGGAAAFFLARRFIKNALLAALLLLATPVVMTMSHTLMADAPMMALWLVSIAAYVYGVDRNDARLMALSGVAALLAVFAGYQAVLLIGLLPLYALLKRRLSLRTAWPVALPLLGFGLYSLYNLWRYGGLPRFKHTGGLSLGRSNVLERLQGMMLQVGGASVFPLMIAGVFSLRRKRYLVLPVIAVAAAALSVYHFRSGHYPLSSAVLFFVFLTASVSMAFAVLSELGLQLANRARRRQIDRDYIFLGLWLFAVLAIVVFFLPHATAKYSLPLLAPLVLLFFREMESGLTPRLGKSLAVAALALTFITGALVSTADNRLAQGNRDFALSFAERYEPEGKVWFVGEWGFRHYMEAQNYLYLTSASEAPQTGDFVVRTEFSDWPLAGPVRDRMKLVETDTSDWVVPLRVMNFGFSAGFYGTHWGDLPYAVTSEPVSKFEIYMIEPAGN